MITSRQNTLVRHVKRLGAERSYRYEHCEFTSAGMRCLMEAVTCGCAVTAVLAVDVTEELEALPVTKVSSGILQYVSPFKTAQDIVFTCKMPENKTEIDASGRYIILDKVQDPGNAGAVIRTAAAFGFDGVLFTHGCADVYNPKTLRSAMGANYRVQIAEKTLEELETAVGKGLTLYGASADGAVDIQQANLESASLAVGNEGAGLSREILELCAGCVSIPMSNGVESLNAAVAVSIIMWEAYRRRN